MGKYEPLRHFLAGQVTSEIRMTFADIEDVIGFPLPEKSKHHRPWWSNNPNNNVMTKEWIAAGFKTEQVDIERGELVFRRVEAPALRSSAKQHEATNTAAPRRRHPIFGAMKGVTWIAPDVDLTEPADPQWADLIDDPDWHP